MDLNKAQEYISNFINNDSIKLYNKIINFEKKHFIPAVKIDTAVFLEFISILFQPKNILEIGFGSGVSSLFINKGAVNNNLFISLERDLNRYNRGISLLNLFNNEKITLIKEDAFNFFKTNNNKFDFIFLDAVKREYKLYLEPLKNILKKDGILICDNIFFGGRVYKEKLEQKYENGVNLLKEFHYILLNDKTFRTNFLLIGDGISISKKII